MFDIGVNLTSSQFSRDRDEVVSRAGGGRQRDAIDGNQPA